MFASECLGELDYEATTAAIFLAGLFLSFLVDYLGARFVLWRQCKRSASDLEAPSAETHDRKTSPFTTPTNAMTHTDRRGSHAHIHDDTDEKLNVYVLEAGIIFHSLRKWLL